MTTRVAIIGIIVEEPDEVERLNQILHEYGRFIIGRMGIPYPKRGINVISIAVDAPQDDINTMSGRIGRLKGITAKTTYSHVFGDDQDQTEVRV
ncbi:MAG: iron-only hydrogenase system regulator [Lachnospiraceae bacterium]|nr:iron-only hydrogenase system regulator [Lachnospiraceae bacterium]